jgi:hypothetical protein
VRVPASLEELDCQGVDGSRQIATLSRFSAKTAAAGSLTATGLVDSVAFPRNRCTPIAAAAARTASPSHGAARVCGPRETQSPGSTAPPDTAVARTPTPLPRRGQHCPQRRSRRVPPPAQRNAPNRRLGAIHCALTHGVRQVVARAGVNAAGWFPLDDLLKRFAPSAAWGLHMCWHVHAKTPQKQVLRK